MGEQVTEKSGSITELAAEQTKTVMAEIDKLKTELDKSEADKAALESDLEEAESVIADLKEKLEAANKKASEATGDRYPTVKVGKKSYDIVIAKFNWQGESKTAADVQKDDKLAAKLVELGSGVLRLKDA